jgi:hypothetical protein
MPPDNLLWGLIIAIAVNAFIQFLRLMKSPKEVNGELSEQISGLRNEQRVNAELTTRHDERIVALTGSINRLIDRIDRLEPLVKRPGVGRTRGDG